MFKLDLEKEDPSSKKKLVYPSYEQLLWELSTKQEQDPDIYSEDNPSVNNNVVENPERYNTRHPSTPEPIPTPDYPSYRDLIKAGNRVMIPEKPTFKTGIEYPGLQSEGMAIGSGKKPVDIPGATNYPSYEKLINADRKARTPNPGLDKGPYSSLIDWDTEENKLKSDSEQKKQAQQKIMRTNAIGDAFRLLIDAVGGSRKATIVPRIVNPGITQAMAAYTKADEDYQARLQGLSTRKLAAASADLQYKHGLEAEKTKETFAISQETQKFLDQIKLGDIKHQYRIDELKQQYIQTGDLNHLKAVVELEQQREMNVAKIEEIKTRERAVRGWGLGVSGEPQFDFRTPSKAGDKNPKIPFILPDKPTETVQIPQELVREMVHQLIPDNPNMWDPRIPPTIRAVLQNKDVKIGSLIEAIRASWPVLKEKMPNFAPNAFDNFYPEETGKVGQVGSRTPVVPKPIVRTDGTIDLDDASKEVLQRKIMDSLNDSTLDLNKDKSVNKKIGEISDLIFGSYTAIGSEMTHNKAVTEANNIMSRFRQKKRQAADLSK